MPKYFDFVFDVPMIVYNAQNQIILPWLPFQKFLFVFDIFSANDHHNLRLLWLRNEVNQISSFRERIIFLSPLQKLSEQFEYQKTKNQLLFYDEVI